MQTDTSFRSAISQVIDNIQEQELDKKIDMGLLTNACIKEFNGLDLPFYSIEADSEITSTIVFEVPFLKSLSLEIVYKKEQEHKKYALLKVDDKIVRRVLLEDTSPEYMKKVAHALLDYLKRFVVLKNKFTS